LATEVRHLFVKTPGFPLRPSNRYNHLCQFLSPESKMLVVARFVN
jgi:hypothetical protein